MPRPTDATTGGFGEVLRGFRERAGLTQQELAERAELTPHAVSSLERGTRTRPYPHTVRSLAAALALAPDERAELLAAVPRRRSTREAGPAGGPAGVVVPATPLFGRDLDLVAVGDLLRGGARLLTLTGPGGVGKTRLAAAVAERVAPDFPDGVVLVSLAPLTEASDVMATAARALGLTGSDGPAVLEAVATHLADRRLLLVLDNLEHLLSAAPEIGRLTALCPAVGVLVTSRSPLRVRGEREYSVAPLAVPRRAAASAEELRSAPAGALLLDRARALAVPPPDGSDVAAYAELCHRLAGLPLAIELVTARLRLLPPRDLLGRLEEAMSAAGARDLPARQRTVRATLDWSFGLLTPEQQQVFTLLGVFRGGASLAAVEAVATAEEELAPAALLEALEELVEHSLVAAQAGPGGDRRVVMLEPVAQYARSLLVGDRAERLMRAHARVFLDLAERAASGYEQAEQVSWLARVEAEEANLLVAIDRALDLGQARTAARITWFMWLYWWLRGQVSVGRRLAERCLSTELPTWERSRAHLARATMAYAGGDQAAAGESWAAADREGAELVDFEVLAKARAGTGLAALAAGDLDDAEGRFRAALDLGRRAGPAGGDWVTALTHTWLGTVLLLRGSPSEAVAEMERGLELSRTRGDRLTTYVALYNLSQAALGLGDVAAARSHLQEGIVLSEETRDLANLAYFLEALAVVEAERGDHERVPALLGAAHGLRETVETEAYAYYQPDEARRALAESAAREALGGDAFEDARDTGAALGLGEMVALALSGAAPGAPGTR